MGIKQAGTFWGRKRFCFHPNSERPLGDKRVRAQEAERGREEASDSKERRNKRGAEVSEGHFAATLQAASALTQVRQMPRLHSSVGWHRTLAPGPQQGHPLATCS